MESLNKPKRGLRPSQAARKFGVSVPTIWRYHRDNPSFPRAKKLSERVTVFDEDELDAFLAEPSYSKTLVKVPA
jgi:prophage regulatory protein